MSRVDRKRLGLVTLQEALRVQQIRQEREMHNLFANWLRLNGVPFVHARMDRKSTIRQGWPDFTLLWQSRVACLEFKLPGQVLDPAQSEVHRELAVNGTRVQTVYSVAEAIRAALELTHSSSAETTNPNPENRPDEGDRKAPPSA